MIVHDAVKWAQHALRSGWKERTGIAAADPQQKHIPEIIEAISHGCRLVCTVIDE